MSNKTNPFSEPLDQWVDENCPDLKKDVDTHISVFASELDPESKENLCRYIMMSIRYKFGGNNKG